MKKTNLLVTIFIATFFNHTFSMGWLKFLLIETFEKQSQSTNNDSDRRRTIESISSLKQSADDGDCDSIVAYSKFEQAVKKKKKKVTELKLKRILDALNLIDSNGQVNNKTREAYKNFKK